MSGAMQSLDAQARDSSESAEGGPSADFFIDCLRRQAENAGKCRRTRRLACGGSVVAGPYRDLTGRCRVELYRRTRLTIDPQVACQNEKSAEPADNRLQNQATRSWIQVRKNQLHQFPSTPNINASILSLPEFHELKSSRDRTIRGANLPTLYHRQSHRHRLAPVGAPWSSSGDRDLPL